MRKTAFIACATILTSALSAQTGASGKFANTSERGLKIEVLPPSPQTHEPLRYVLNEPAYVAAFVVYPGSGVRLLYPLVDVSEQLHTAGLHVDQLTGGSFDDYGVILGPALNGPAYLYIIASRHPLDVTRYVHRPMRLASAVGREASRSFYADVAFDAIVNNAISLGDDQSWDSDVYTLWPESALQRRSTSSNQLSRSKLQYHLVSCGNGTTQAVPYNYPFTGCPGDMKVRRNAVAPKAPVQQAALAGNNAPTVLPTIIGKRVSDADRRAEIGRDAASQRVMYTAANGDQAAPEPVAGVSPSAQVEVIDGRLLDRRAWHSRASDADNRNGRERQERQGEVVGGSPQLAPNPKLAPNPRVSPAPGFGQSSRDESQQREVRNSMRVAPPAPPRSPTSGTAKP